MKAKEKKTMVGTESHSIKQKPVAGVCVPLRITFHARRPPASALAGCGYDGAAWSVQARSLRATPFSCLTLLAVPPLLFGYRFLCCVLLRTLTLHARPAAIYEIFAIFRDYTIKGPLLVYAVCLARHEMMKSLYSQGSEAGATRSEPIARIWRLMAILV